MQHHEIDDWDDAYANADHIPDADKCITNWPIEADRFRGKLAQQNRSQLDIAYGGKPRNRLDLFLPEATPKGLIIFVHGGYWYRFDKSFFSHFAKGALDSGWAVAMPSYTLCPDIRVAGITKEVGKAIDHAAKLVKGPIRLAGHSAGGHLVARMVSNTSPLSASVLKRLERAMVISPVSDLRPLCRLKLNQTICLTQKEAANESPALLLPIADLRITCWVGASELPEFIRQNALLANIWHGLGAGVTLIEEPDRHHFNVIDGLKDENSTMMKALLDQIN